MHFIIDGSCPLVSGLFGVTLNKPLFLKFIYKCMLFLNTSFQIYFFNIIPNFSEIISRIKSHSFLLLFCFISPLFTFFLLSMCINVINIFGCFQKNNATNSCFYLITTIKC